MACINGCNGSVGAIKKRSFYQQAKPLDRWVFLWLLGHLEKKYGQDHILFADEAGFYSTERYEWGWGKKRGAL
ncbi:hypothetical protein [Thiothrix nivea]|uniref:hypothetical protein n=1 Tax=Thiothrix nivea TaxID=1031 RepID=UPI0002E16F5D|nr:hypothetical protein [Thiothrix nivea]